MSTKPNFLILMVDQMTGTLLDESILEKLHIPNIKKLIDNGVLFNNAYSSSPLCTPSRGSFMSGQLPSRNGVYDNAAEFTSTTPTFAHYLRNLGYQTALSGKMHFVGADQLHGFEERLTTDIYPGDFGWTPDWENPLERIDWWYHNLSSVTEAGTAEITNQLEFDDEVTYQAKLKLYEYARRLDNRPFCLCASFTHPHDPYVSRQKYWDLYDHADIPMPVINPIGYEDHDPHSQRILDAVDYTRFEVTEDDVRNARHAYFANISYLDEKIGELLDVLKSCDFNDSTHVVLCSDHGDMLGEKGLWYKMTFFENACRVPFVISAPEMFEPTRINTPVANHDLLPSLVELAGGDPDKLACEIDGQSIVDLAKGNENPDRSVYSEYCAEASVAPMIMIRKGKYKFIYCPADPVQLYDLEADPHELKNIAEDPEMLDLMRQFSSEMNQRWDFEVFTDQVKHSQRCRKLVDSANRNGKFVSWDYEPKRDSTNRFMRNHMDLNVVETNNRYPKPE